MNPSRLSFGSGPVVRDGWRHSDLRWWPGMQMDGPGARDHVGAIQDGLPFADGELAYCVASHSLQMLPWPDLVPALTELRRVTRKGGAIRILVPDLLAAFSAYINDQREHFKVAPKIESSLDGAFCVYVTQAGATRSVFTRSHLADLLVRAGWAEPHRMPFGVTRTPYAGIVDLDDREDESLIVEAVNL